MNKLVDLVKEFALYPEAFELKQLGFDEPCFGYYNTMGFNRYFDNIKNSDNLIESENIKGNWCTAPTYSQVFRWFRNKHQIVCVIDFYNDGDLWEDTMYTVTISEFEHFNSHDSFVQFEYKTYEEAELACLRKLIEIVKNK